VELQSGRYVQNKKIIGAWVQAVFFTFTVTIIISFISTANCSKNQNTLPARYILLLNFSLDSFATSACDACRNAHTEVFQMD